MAKKTKKKDDEYISIDLSKIINYKHLPLAILLLASLILNMYYFSTNKAVWWDEADYLSFVNFLTKGIPSAMWTGRAIIYPLILSIFGIINSSENFLRFGLMIISLLTVSYCYLLLKKLSDKKTAFFATLLFQTSFLFLFFQIRFLTEIPSTLFTLMGLYYFLNKDLKSKIFAGIFIGLAIGIRFTSILIIPAMLLYSILSKSNKLKNYSWIFSIIIGFAPVLIYELINGNYPFYSIIYFFVFSSQSPLSQPWHYFISSHYIYGLLSAPFFILGLLKYAKLNRKKILILSFFIIYFFMHSFVSSHKEDRYIIPILPVYFLISVQGMFLFVDLLLNYLKKANSFFKSKNLNFALIFLLCLAIICPSLMTSNDSIQFKSESYYPVKEATIFLQDYLPESDIVLGNTPQINYYSERELIYLPSTSAELYELLDENPNINTIVISAFEHIPDYAEEFNNQEKFRIINVAKFNNESAVYVIAYNRD
ncbi:MAG: glycosyltransferase family 39 protein [Candidatus Nanoarchaeia archaeon]|nr:glycosyltransferase family 39 protein [Candidatus Nanoarchaeia archaeon]